MSPGSLKTQGHPFSNRRLYQLETKTCSTAKCQFGHLTFEETFASREEAIEFGLAEGKKLIDSGELSQPTN
jgi:hypothetical protein